MEAITYEYTSWLDPNDTKSMIDALDLMVGDYQFTCPTIEFADRSVFPVYQQSFFLWNIYFSRRYAETFNSVFQYYYDHRASNHPWPNWTGVLHGDEINFVFGEPLNRSLDYNDEEKAFAKDVMTFWSNFAKTG